MGTQVDLTVYAPTNTSADEACRDAFSRLAELDDIMSDYRADSELMRLCAQAGGPPVPISADLFAVLYRAYDLAERSGGAFDVTAGPYVQLWREARRTGKMPAQAEWEAAVKLVGYKKMRLDPQARTVQLLQPGMKLDLGGIGKGYALDQALIVLRRHGLTRALITAGGDIAVGDPPPGRKGWRIQIWRPGAGPRRLILANCGVSTSGDTEQFVQIGGKRYSHIVDPRCGRRLAPPVLATVVAPDATTSDGLATACVVLGREEGEKLVRTIPGARLFYRCVEFKRQGPLAERKRPEQNEFTRPRIYSPGSTASDLISRGLRC